jgi:hypothetical protein
MLRTRHSKHFRCQERIVLNQLSKDTNLSCDRNTLALQVYSCLSQEQLSLSTHYTAWREYVELGLHWPPFLHSTYVTGQADKAVRLYGSLYVVHFSILSRDITSAEVSEAFLNPQENSEVIHR